MLRQRVITAVVLLALLLPALFAADPRPFELITLLLISAAGWEWARLNGLTAPWSTWASGVALALCCAITLAAPPAVGSGSLWQSAALAWLVGGALALRAGPSGWPRLPLALRWLIGVGLLWLGWTAIALARSIGVNFLLSVLCIVWAADIAAYFGGRAFGARKLAPTISPGKTWEGAACGMLGVALLAALWLAAEAHWSLGSASVFRLLRQRLDWPGLGLGLVLLTGLSVIGDLFESLVKRAAGAKDSSRLLPGHGGVLDRIDALLPVLPASLALISL
jgi:phosphatidate cytidylyltransferase